jgi:hypothetical protein
MRIPKSPIGRDHAGHSHFREQLLSRRQLVGASVAATALLGSRLLIPKRVFANDRVAAPRPIPGGTAFLSLCGSPDPTVFHAYSPEAGAELSTITDFNGVVGATEITGTGTGVDTRTGRTTRLFFDTDMRFMRGEFIGLDGREHEGTFGFL